MTEESCDLSWADIFCRLFHQHFYQWIHYNYEIETQKHATILQTETFIFILERKRY